ncbi:MAG: hypothetical protein Q8Q41_00580 [bacterium]|nr:hypothetical protein [bacterium]
MLTTQEEATAYGHRLWRDPAGSGDGVPQNAVTRTQPGLTLFADDDAKEDENPIEEGEELQDGEEELDEEEEKKSGDNEEEGVM